MKKATHCTATRSSEMVAMEIQFRFVTSIREAISIEYKTGWYGGTRTMRKLYGKPTGNFHVLLSSFFEVCMYVRVEYSMPNAD